MTDNHLPVLIVGAGPTGLMMACELKRHNIPFRIIDKKSAPTQGSNATWIQSRTLEILDIIGMADSFLRLGHRCHAINLYESNRQLANIPFQSINSNFPFILMLPQSETERLLQAKLTEAKIRVERSTELLELQQTSDSVTAIVRLPSGETESITCRWLIACDGANGIVREKCKMPFPGSDIPEQFMVADATMRSFLPTDEVHVFFEKGDIFSEKATLFSAFPWNTREYRLSANLYSSHPRQFFTEHEVKEVVAERAYGNFVVENVSWISPFWMHSNIVDHMQQQSIFLVGDAAHIHCPVGGQGMNSGLQDAFNLAWKIALVIRKQAPATLLNSYQAERYTTVKRVVEKTEELTRMMLFEKTFFSKFRKFCKSVSLSKNANKISTELSQLNIRYTESPIIDYYEKPPASAPKQGERALDVVLSQNSKLSKYFQHTKHTVLLFTGTEPSPKKNAGLIELQNWLNQHYAEQINTYLVTTAPSHTTLSVIEDNQAIIHERYHVKAASLYLIRPDSYIGYYSKKLNQESIKAFLDRYLLA